MDLVWNFQTDKFLKEPTSNQQRAISTRSSLSMWFHQHLAYAGLKGAKIITICACMQNESKALHPSIWSTTETMRETMCTTTSKSMSTKSDSLVDFLWGSHRVQLEMISLMSDVWRPTNHIKTLSFFFFFVICWLLCWRSNLFNG